MTSSFAKFLSDLAVDVSQFINYNYNLTEADMNKLMGLIDENGIQVLVKHGYNPTCGTSLNEFWEEVLDGHWHGFLTIDDSKDRAQFMDLWMSRCEDINDLDDYGIAYMFEKEAA